MLAILTLSACSASPAPVPEMAGRYEGGGVTVELAVRAGLLTATFTPPDGFHLYSMDLPAGGVDGIGFPTVARPGGALTPTGPVTADRAVTELRPAGLGLVVPVYPDGPVTLTVPVRAGAGDQHEVTVGYAACSAGSCLPPVTGEQVVLHTIDR
ncbi:protein-disulfide reductase DsbD domain-containing protein [Actinoplanes flavus]|uniref:Thiol:disulfide interchange protein DsbD N-terminal domain-containing protein n=1 Tax=Actinoplanes flavus TaxID=2820290 RepID=A0ABS3UFF5_9ACTN|nr:protein-disulfide reductase DsbD domain-containing protein [Actinoplanes flavus]MBO3737186.1 hypothetical protein [Actinoplanes flavus]